MSPSFEPMDVTDFIKEYADSVTKLELLVFFYDNPSTMDTIESLSIWSGIPRDDVQHITSHWCDLHLMEQEGDIYFFKIDTSLQPLIKQVVRTYKATRRMFRSELEKIINEKDEETKLHRYELSAEVGKTDTILENITDGVLLVNEEQIIMRYNRAFGSLFPTIKTRNIPVNFDIVFEDKRIRRQFMALSQQGEGTFFETFNDRHYEIKITGIKDEDGNYLQNEDGVRIGCLWVFRDISARKELDRMKEDLSKMITHDLRSPMTGIFTAFDLILRSGKKTLPAHIYKSCQLGKRTSQFIIGMVNDLIDIHKIEDDSIPIEKVPLNINKIVEDSIEQIVPIIYDRNIKIHRSLPSKPLSMLGDQQKLIRVTVNILTNAVKFTPKNGNIRITLKKCPVKEIPFDLMPHLKDSKKQKMLKLIIQDDGYGIPEECLPFIFDKYYRVRQGKQHIIAGTGLGLYFCKLIILAHQGEIWAESKLEEGSTFFMVLPLLT